MALQIRRGLQANLPSSPAEGELLYATDTGNLYIGVSGSPTLISFGAGGGIADLSSNSIADLGDVSSLSGIADGQALLWNAANSRFEYGNVVASGSTYGDSNVLTLLNGGVSTSIVPSANVTYDLGNATNRWGDLYLSGNTIILGDVTISSDSGNLSFNSNNLATENFVTARINALIAGAPEAVDTLAEIANAIANSNATLSAVAFSGDYNDTINRPTMTLSGNAYLSFDGANIDLTGVVGQTGPKGDTGNTGATGPQGVSVSSATVTAGNLIITLDDSSTLNAGSVVGPKGDKGDTGNTGATGPQGVSVSSATVTGGNLIITLDDSSTLDAGNVVGPQGPQGPQGDGDAGVSSAAVNGSGNLIITLNDSTTIDAGNVRGEQGDAGTNGVGITSAALVGANLVLNYSNTSTQDVGNIQGPQGGTGPKGDTGNTGPQGVSVSSATITAGNLIITLDDSSTLNAGSVIGPQGNTGSQGPAGVDVTSASVNGSGNLIITLSDASTIDAGNVRGADGAVDQTLNLTGNVLTISGSNSSVDFTTVLGSFHTTNTDAQTLTLVGSSLGITGGNSVDLSGLGGGIADLSGNVLADLGDVSATSPSNGQALIWNTSSNTWAPGNVVSSANTFSTISVSGQNNVVADSTSDTLTLVAGSGISITTNSTSDSITIAATGGGGGGGAVVEMFKVNYATNGSLSSISDLSSGISNVTIDSAASGDITVTFTGYNFPPGSIMIYGYDRPNNKYYISNLETTMAVRELVAGGTAGSPTAFDGSSTPVIKLRVSEAVTGASRSLGTTTHAWLRITMYD